MVVFPRIIYSVLGLAFLTSDSGLYSKTNEHCYATASPVRGALGNSASLSVGAEPCQALSDHVSVGCIVLVVVTFSKHNPPYQTIVSSSSHKPAKSKMGSDPQFSKFPNLALAQNIFSVANTPSTSQTSLQYIQNAIKEHKMAPLYRHLAHPTEGVLNAKGEGTAAAATSAPTPSPSVRRGSLVSSNLLPPRRSLSSGLIPWDENLYEELKADNEKELEQIQKEEDDAVENAGETEVQAARGKRAEFWARVGDKVRRHYEPVSVSLTNKRCRTNPLNHTKQSSKRLVLSAQRSILSLP